jgi:hypothetical protein
MATTIAGYFTDELLDWNHAISFHDEEMSELEKKLGEVIRRNGIADIAGKVEAQQKLLDQVADKFYRLQIEFQLQEEVLKTDSRFIENTSINHETEIRQAELRRKVEALEKEYIDVKFNCYNFLSGIFTKQND